MTKQEKTTLDFIKVVRESFNDASTIYTQGACYSFYKILKQVFPTAEAYETAEGKNYNEGGHIITKIADQFYDIEGIVSQGINPAKRQPLSELEHIEWEANVYGMRAENMIKKYCKQFN